MDQKHKCEIQGVKLVVEIPPTPPSIARLQEDIVVATHNPEWFDWYHSEKAALDNVFGPNAVAFEHVGSSRVPGLDSKPIVDILVGVKTLELTDAQTGALSDLGYEYFGRLHAAVDRLFARKRGAQSFNLQIVPFGQKEWIEKLAFRDYLLANPDAVAEYSRIKQEAIREGKTALLDYHKHKDMVVSAILEKALKWKGVSPQ
jgi:GrpB-like predicted nucleotidyltransferase (UPF0157 family)